MSKRGTGTTPGSSLLDAIERWIPTARLAERAALKRVFAEAERYRIEADNAMRDYDALELDAGIMREALAKIATKRPNKIFDPWAAETARLALVECRVDV